jgi:putative DNA methylase
MQKTTNDNRIIETDKFPFEFISLLAERESWRKEIHRPIYHIHKWWATRLGSVFRSILLGCILKPEEDLTKLFYKNHSFSGVSVFDPFMGSGTTVGEAHKLGFTALGRDINPVAVESVKVSLGPLNQGSLQNALIELSRGVGKKISKLYYSKDSRDNDCDVLYYFWVMQIICPKCHQSVDLFPSWVIAGNAYPKRNPEVQILCPSCREIFRGIHGQKTANCKSCGKHFVPEVGTVIGPKATCSGCGKTFAVVKAISEVGKKPKFHLYGKLVLTKDGEKEYLKATVEDDIEYKRCSKLLKSEIEKKEISLPILKLEDGYNTRQAINYGFYEWKDFFNDRQLLALGWLQSAIKNLRDKSTRNTFLVLFSGLLEFNNMFVSYKGEGTGAVRHMFSHHILKPERMPIEANIWGTPKSSGSFSNLVRGRLLRAIRYRLKPTEVNGLKTEKGLVCSLPFSGKIESEWPFKGGFVNRGIYISQGDSSVSGLPDRSIDLVITDPPFFDNVHYSELADFFYAWQQTQSNGSFPGTTRNPAEVQDSDPEGFSKKLSGVLRECNRILKDDGLLIFTYHHSRDDGWKALANAIFNSGFVVINSHPVKSEMSVATPKAQAKEPIQLDTIIICRKLDRYKTYDLPNKKNALEIAVKKIKRLQSVGFSLSHNDRKIVYFGQLLTTLLMSDEIESVIELIQDELKGSTTKSVSFPQDSANSLTTTGIHLVEV